MERMGGGAEGVGIRRIGPGEVDVVVAASYLFDGPADPAATARFLDSPDHHLFLAFDGGRAVGFVSGIETTHPDKGVEMFLYELAVDEPARGRGIGVALVDALRTLAEERGCYGMWVLTDADNEAAIRTYRHGGAGAPSTYAMLDWRFDR